MFSLGLLRQDPSWHLREWSDSAVREVRQDLGPASHDGPHDRDEQGLRFRHLHNQRRGPRSRQTGKEVCLVFSTLRISLGINKYYFKVHLILNTGHLNLCLAKWVCRVSIQTWFSTRIMGLKHNYGVQSLNKLGEDMKVKILFIPSDPRISFLSYRFEA